MGGVGVMPTRWCLRCEIEGLRYCGKLAFRADALLVVLVNVCVRSIPALADAHPFLWWRYCFCVRSADRRYGCSLSGDVSPAAFEADAVCVNVWVIRESAACLLV